MSNERISCGIEFQSVVPAYPNVRLKYRLFVVTGTAGATVDRRLYRYAGWAKPWVMYAGVFPFTALYMRDPRWMSRRVDSGCHLTWLRATVALLWPVRIRATLLCLAWSLARLDLLACRMIVSQ